MLDPGGGRTAERVRQRRRGRSPCGAHAGRHSRRQACRLREAPGTQCRRRLGDVGRGGESGSEAPVLLQLPLRPCCAAGAGHAPRRRPGRGLPGPFPLLAELAIGLAGRLSGDHWLPCHRPGALLVGEIASVSALFGDPVRGQEGRQKGIPKRLPRATSPTRWSASPADPGHHRRLRLFARSTQHARLGDQLRERHARMGPGAPERAESVRDQLCRSLAGWIGRRHRLRAWPSLQ